MNTEVVIGGMRIALGKLAKEGVPAEDMATVFRQKLEDIQDSADPATDAIALFGQRAGADLAAAIREGRFTIDDYVALIADGSYTVEAAIADSRTFADTFGESSLSEESRTHAAPSGVCDHPHAGGSP